MMIKYYQSYGNNDTEIHGRYRNAAEARNRVATSFLTDVIGHSEKLIRNFQRLKAMLAVDLIEHSTSVPGQILASINTIVQQTQYSLTEFRSEIFDKFSEYYEQNADFRVRQMVHAAKFILGHHFLFSNIDVNDTFYVSQIEKVFDHGDALCRDLNILYFNLNLSEANFSTKVFIDKTCYKNIDCHSADLDRAFISDPDYIDLIIEIYKKMALSARAALKCVPMYRTFLDEVQMWLNYVLNINANLPLKLADRRHFLTELEQQLNWMKAMSHRFAERTLVWIVCVGN